MMSVRPDVLPQSALDELRILQDSVKPFDTPTAIKQIESELGGELGQFFTEISEKPVAAASLAQVYKARLASTGEFVAVKIQRPAVLDVVSKDLYVLRRAAEVYQGLMDRFAPQQRTNYVALLNEWAVGFYTELDFLNEAANQQRLKDLLISEKVSGMYVPKVHDELCTRRVLVSEWIDGKKLSECETAVLKDLIPDAQEAFLTQLLQVGFFHSGKISNRNHLSYCLCSYYFIDPHPGNILLMNEPRGDAKMALIDFGLVASIKQEDMDTMVSAIIHLANRDYANLVDDFIELGILPTDCDRPKVIPLMDKALTPYVKGGGAQKYEEELRKIYGMDGTMSGTAGGFQAMTQDALTVLNDIPFSIPPYFALLARAIVTLEGVALSANPNYGIIMESYPFVARKLLKEDRPEIQRALQQVLYSRGDGLQTTRLSVLLNSALGVVAKSSNVFVDLDSIPEDAVSIGTSLKFLMSKSAGSLRKILVEEAIGAGDILLRQTVRKSYSQILNNLPRPPLIGQFLPKPETVRVPFLVPRVTSGEVSLDNFSNLTPVFLTPVEFIDAASPKLSREEELYALSLTDIATQTLGRDAGIVANGNTLLEPSAAARLVLNIISSTDQLPGIPSQVPVKDISNRLLRPLLMAGGNARNPFQLLSTLLTSQGSVKIDESAKDKEGLGDLVDGINALTPEESAVFQETVNKIIGGLRERTVLRLQSVL